MEIIGTYPMLYAFFDAEGALIRDAVETQVAAAEANGASGIAVLGLGTEAAKLGRVEKRQILEWTIAAVGGRLPIAATLSAGNVADMTEEARIAHDLGAAWLILQPPRPPASGADLVAFFGKVADAVDCPIAIQNAPEFLGIGLTAAELAALAEAHPNVVAVKAECSAVALADLADALGGRMRLLNGRAGLELTDNFRAGADGMIPGIETIDLQVAVEKAMRRGDEAEAEAHYRRLLPAIAFAMQGLAHFILYGKLIAAHRLGLPPSIQRLPAQTLSQRGAQWAARLAADLGPLAH